MPSALEPRLRQILADRISFYRELGIYDFYRRDGGKSLAVDEDFSSPTSVIEREEQEMARASKASVALSEPEEDLFAAKKPESLIADPAQALRVIREDLGDCTRCRLHKQGRKQIVFGVGNPKADLMFIGEAPGVNDVRPVLGDQLAQLEEGS